MSYKKVFNSRFVHIELLRSTACGALADFCTMVLISIAVFTSDVLETLFLPRQPRLILNQFPSSLFSHSTTAGVRGLENSDYKETSQCLVSG